MKLCSSMLLLSVLLLLLLSMVVGCVMGGLVMLHGGMGDNVVMILLLLLLIWHRGMGRSRMLLNNVASRGRRMLSDRHGVKVRRRWSIDLWQVFGHVGHCKCLAVGTVRIPLDVCHGYFCRQAKCAGMSKPVLPSSCPPYILFPFFAMRSTDHVE